MKKMKLFTRTFLYTMLLMCMIIVISHALLYFMMPGVYVSYKNNEVDDLAARIKADGKDMNVDGLTNKASEYVTDIDANITIQIGDQIYLYSEFATMNSYTAKSNTNDYKQSIEIKGIDEGVKKLPKIESELDPSLQTDSHAGSVFHVIDSDIKQATSLQRDLEVTLKSGEVANVSITMNLQPVDDASNVMFMILPYTIGISILISLIAAYLYTRALTNPIHSICASTKEMEALHPDALCAVERQDEIGELAADINSLYRSLQETIHSLESEIEHVSQAEKGKVDFLRSASHELKTPLTSLSVMLENMLLNVGKYKDHETYLSKCKDVVDRLSLMIKDILDASSLEQIKLDLNTEAYDFGPWLLKLLEPYRTIAKSKGIRIDVQVNESFLLKKDAALLGKALSNILSNAIQYTESGKSITVTLVHHRLIINNECEPIPEEHLSHITEAFYRPDFSRTKQTGGNGLGLYFVDQILYQLNIPYEFTPYPSGMRFIIDCSEA